MTPVQPPGTRRSAAAGLRVWDRDLACPGFTLFTPAAPQSIVYLINLGREVAESWCLPYPALNGCLMHRGTLVYNGRIDGPGNTFVTANASKGGVLLEVDLAGEVLWEVRHKDHHHDGIRLANGNALLLCIAEVPRQRVVRQRYDVSPGVTHPADSTMRPSGRGGLTSLRSVGAGALSYQCLVLRRTRCMCWMMFGRLLHNELRIRSWSARDGQIDGAADNWVETCPSTSQPAYCNECCRHCKSLCRPPLVEMKNRNG